MTRQMHLNQRRGSGRRTTFVPPRCPSLAPFENHHADGATRVRCILDEGHGGGRHFADGFEWTGTAEGAA